MKNDLELSAEEMDAVSGGTLNESRKQALLCLIKRSKAGGKSMETILSLAVDRDAKEFIRQQWENA